MENDNDNNNVIKNEMKQSSKQTIKSIVASGGGQYVMTFFGVLKQAFETKYLDWSHIQSLYGTSAGALILAVLSLKIDMSIVDEYLKKRPWNTLFNMNIENCLEAYDKKGIFCVDHFYAIFEPLLKSQDLDTSITLKELYEYNQIDLHVYATEMNSFQYVDFSHHTHPEWKLVDVIYASACIPVMFSPLIIEDKCYIDGSPTMDFAIEIACAKFREDEIFAIKKVCKNKDEPNIRDDMHLLEFVQKCFEILMRHRILQKSSKQIRNTVYVSGSSVSMGEIINMTSSVEVREKMIHAGETLFDDFYEISLSTSCEQTVPMCSY